MKHAHTQYNDLCYGDHVEMVHETRTHTQYNDLCYGDHVETVHETRTHTIQ